MNRLFGYGSKKSRDDQLLQESSQAMNQAQEGLQQRMSQLDTQIYQINVQLQALQKKIGAVRPNAQRPLRQQALKLLNKRKQLEQMRDSMDSQAWSMTQAQMTSDNLKNTMVTVNALKQTNKALKTQYGKINVDKLQDMQDEMVDLIEQGDELQQVLAMNAVGVDIDDIDETELDAELDALADEDFGDALTNTSGGVELPSYLSNTVPQFIDEEPQQDIPEQDLETAR